MVVGEDLDKVSVYRLIDDPQDPMAFYWASRGNGLYYTYDEGRSWRQSVEPLNAGFIYSVAVNPEDKWTLLATNGSYVYKSVDCNRSWVEVHREDRSESRVSSIVYDPFGKHDLFMSKINGDLLVSRDGGSSWTVTQRLGKRIEAISADTNSKGVLYLATRDDGIMRSDDSGVNWVELSEGLNQYPGAKGYRRLLVHPKKANVLYWVSTYGILVSTDKGVSWASIALITSPGSVDIFGFAINPNNDKEIYYTAVSNNRATFYKTADGGKTWITKKLPSGQIPTVLRLDPVKGETISLGFTIPPQK